MAPILAIKSELLIHALANRLDCFWIWTTEGGRRYEKRRNSSYSWWRGTSQDWNARTHSRLGRLSLAPPETLDGIARNFQTIAGNFHNSLFHQIFLKPNESKDARLSWLFSAHGRSWTSVKIGRMRIIAYEAPWRAEPNPRVKIKWAIKNRVRGA